MDEVDFFGDRIVIMVEGVVKCCGIFLFLKKVFGKYIKNFYFIFNKYLKLFFENVVSYNI